MRVFFFLIQSKKKKLVLVISFSKKENRILDFGNPIRSSLRKGSRFRMYKYYLQVVPMPLKNLKNFFSFSKNGKLRFLFRG